MALCLLIIVFLGSIFQGLDYKTKWNLRNYSIFVIFGILLIVAATFRPSFMPDYEPYLKAILYNTSERFEPSFYVIRDFWRFLGLNPYGTLMTYAFLGTTIMLYCIKRDSDFPWFSLALFVSIYFILGEMIQIRQAVATSILFVGVRYLYKRDILKYCICFLFAFFFHYSAIIMIPLLFISPYTRNLKFYFTLFKFRKY